MQWRALGFYKSIGDLVRASQGSRSLVTTTDVRKKVPIAVIDDEPLAAEGNLRSHGYDITQIGDIKNVDEVAEYRIVLCDLMGVGHHFDKVRQGASVIEEIRLNYPAIIVVAYSGSSLASAPARAAKEHADRTLRKDADINEWRRTLDELIQKSSDPEFIWRRTRIRLTEMDLDTKSILILEDAYVKTILSKDQNADKIKTALTTSTLSQDIRAVAHGLVSAAIFSIVAS